MPLIKRLKLSRRSVSAPACLQQGASAATGPADGAGAAALAAAAPDEGLPEAAPAPAPDTPASARLLAMQSAHPSLMHALIEVCRSAVV